jgi:hypothetical protein
LLVCSRDPCSEGLKADCVSWLAEVETEIPTIVLRASDPDGRDLTSVRVSIDDKVVASTLDGLPIALNPGTHHIVAEAADLPPVASDVVLSQGQKLREVALRFSARPALQPPPVAPASSSPPPPPRPPPPRPITWPTIVFAGVGVAGLAGFTGFGLAGRSDYRDLEGCRGHCAEDDMSRTRRELLLADVSLVVSVLALGAATYFFLTRPSLPAKSDVSAAGRTRR